MPRATQDAATPRMLARTRLSRSAAQLSRCFRLPCRVRVIAVLQPRPRLDGDGLGSSLFARHYWGNHSYFLFLRVLRCFSSPRWPPRIPRGWHPFRMPGCPIRTPADQWPFAPTRGFSQLITSFIASESQGIRHVPFFAFPKGRTYAACFCTRAGTPGRNPDATREIARFRFPFTTCHRTMPRRAEWRITDSNR